MFQNKTEPILVRTLRFFDRLGLGLALREVYKHSVWKELIFRIKYWNISLESEIFELNDFNMYLKPKLGVDKDLMLHGVREEESVEIYRDKIDEESVVVDVGGNIGYFPLVAADHAERVYCFEPSLRCRERLEDNLELNNCENIRLFDKAVGSENGVANFEEADELNCNHISKETEEGSRKVEVVSLDDFLGDRVKDIDIVRMDVEGYEMKILEGMNRILDEDIKLFIEIHTDKLQDYGSSTEDFWRLMDEKGFKIDKIISHPLSIYPSYFIRSSHPPRKIIEVNEDIKSFLEDPPDILRKDTYRIFLEK